MDASARGRDRADHPPSRALIAVAAATGGLLLVAVVVLLALSLGEISSTRDHVAATDAKAERALALVDPLADEAAPVLEQAEPLAEQLPPLLRDVSRLVGPLSDRGDDLSVLIERFPALEFGLRRLVGETLPLLESLDVAELQATTSIVRELAVPLIENDRLVTSLDRVSRFLAAVEERRLIPRAVQGDRTLRKVLRVQRLTLGAQRQALAIQGRSFEVQRQSLEHIRSIDNKLGGQLLSPP